MTPVRVLADHHVYRLSELITGDHHLDTFNPEEGLPAQVGTYEALIIRTVTPINRHTLPQKGHLRFIATASVGFDHIDLVHLEQLGIQVVSAAGSNARAVAEYVVTMMLYTCMNQGWDYRTLSVGIVGVGHTGGAVHALMEKWVSDVAYLIHLALSESPVLSPAHVKRCSTRIYSPCIHPWIGRVSR